MKKFSCIILLACIVFLIETGCKDKSSETPESTKAQETHRVASLNEGYAGTVLDTMDAGGYTYVQVKTEKEEIWAAAPKCQVKVGDKVVIPEGMPMTDFESKTLNRTFSLVYFVSNILLEGAESKSQQFPEGHPEVDETKTNFTGAAQMDFSGIEKPQGGVKIDQIYAQKSSLSGKEVLVRGKVVKFSSAIMGKNWIHLRDGTGNEGLNDLTITTQATVNVGDTVLIQGVLTLDKDFGYGYNYDLIIEDAKVTVE